MPFLRLRADSHDPRPIRSATHDCRPARSASLCRPHAWLPAISLSLFCGWALAQAAPGMRNAAMSNRTETARLSAIPGRPELEIRDVATGHVVAADDLFTITLESGTMLRSTTLQWDSGFSQNDSTESSQSALPRPHSVCADLSDPRSGARFHWCLLSQSDRAYMQARLTITAAGAELPITSIELLNFEDSDAKVVGTVKGSPAADQDMYFGFENPLSWSRVQGGRVEAGISRVLPLRAKQSVTEAAVVGTYPRGQLRRTFLAFIEAERPRAYRPFLNYNTWYDIGYTNRFSESDVLDRIHAFGHELIDSRHAHMDSFVLDDGWDNSHSLWDFDSGFPGGLTRVTQEAARYRAGVGIWLSPWGGYDQQKLDRIAFGQAHGYEIMNGGFALSAPRYFQAFSAACSQMVERYHVNLFKFDGTGNADRVFPGSVFDSDFAAAIHLIGDLRRQEPGIFINLTTGTYPSPFWLLHADSIWRGGDDHSFAGVGSRRQQWITYRDAQTYRNIVQGGPLFPLNSLMLHGIIYAQKAEGLSSDPKHDFADEVLSYFGSGTQLQEMYVTPSLLTSSDWDILARAARWSRDHAAILEDSHWIGGDPGKLQVYGWGAWNPGGWIITVRNPSDRGLTFVLDPGAALELPAGAAKSFSVRQPFATPQTTPQQWQAGKKVSIPLQPFEVRIYERDSR